MDATLATDVLQEALEKYPKPKTFNSDQGSQYTSYEHTKLLKDLKEGVKAYIHKYNFKRFHSSINYQKPMNMYLEYLKNVA